MLCPLVLSDPVLLAAILFCPSSHMLLSCTNHYFVNSRYFLSCPLLSYWPHLTVHTLVMFCPILSYLLLAAASHSHGHPKCFHPVQSNPILFGYLQHPKSSFSVVQLATRYIFSSQGVVLHGTMLLSCPC